MRLVRNARATDAVAPALETDGERLPVIWFEVENLLRYFDHFSNPTGIQRVSLEILAAAEKAYGPAGRVKFCRLSLYTGQFQQVGFGQILAARANGSEINTPWSLIPMLSSRRRWRKILATAASFPTYAFRVSTHFLLDLMRLWRRREFERLLIAGDTIVCLGGSWLKSRYSEYITAVKEERGVHFVQLIHDVIPIFNPQWTPLFGPTFDRWLNRIAPVTDLFLTISACARRDLLGVAAARNLAIPPVEVIRYGANFEPGRGAVGGSPKNNLEQLPHSYVLCVSTLEVRKNHRLLLAVWRRLLARHGGKIVPALVLVGRVGYYILDSRPLLKELAASNYLNGKVILMSDLADEELAEVYRRCLFTVFPSLYEGWGMPVAESLARDKFCVASNRSSIPEVGGDLVDYFDPTDEQDAQAKIERALFDPSYLAERESQIRTRYKPPSWSDCVHEIVGTIEKLSPERKRHAAVNVVRGLKIT